MRSLTEAKLFVDTGDPEEARQVQEMLVSAGYAGLDGATTNPSYFAKNPKVQARIEKGKKFSREELLLAYREAVEEIDRHIPGGDISIEVYGDMSTPAQEMIEQAREMSTWVPGARIKLPIIEQGLLAAEQLKDDIKLNMTLCFSQQQAAAVYESTMGAKENVFISPFIGRFDDIGQNGAQFVANVLRMMKAGDDHVEVLAASFRRVDNILEMIRVGIDIMTINKDRFDLWAEGGWKMPNEKFVYEFNGQDIPYEEVELGRGWREYDLQSDLTDVGLRRFIDDWNSLLI